MKIFFDCRHVDESDAMVRSPFRSEVSLIPLSQGRGGSSSGIAPSRSSISSDSTGDRDRSSWLDVSDLVSHEGVLEFDRIR